MQWNKTYLVLFMPKTCTINNECLYSYCCWDYFKAIASLAEHKWAPPFWQGKDALLFPAYYIIERGLVMPTEHKDTTVFLAHAINMCPKRCVAIFQMVHWRSTIPSPIFAVSKGYVTWHGVLIFMVINSLPDKDVLLDPTTYIILYESCWLVHFQLSAH